MAEDAQVRTHPVGEALYQELVWVHTALRRDLATVNRLAEQILDGLPGTQIRARIGALQTGTPLWQLKAHCLTYCRFVHGHHSLEDVALFPAVRRTHPRLAPEVDRLEADHREVARYVAAVEAAAERLSDRDTTDTREQLAQALRLLSRHLLAHLELEEQTIGPAMREWEREPWG